MDTEQDMETLLEEREKCMCLDIPEVWYKKIPGWDKLEPGDKIKIQWAGEVLEGIEDDGYLFQLPICDDDHGMLDFFVHIPSPDNSSGIGDAPQVFTHLISLMENKLVKKLIHSK